MDTEEILFEVDLIGDGELEVAGPVILATVLYFLSHGDFSLLYLFAAFFGIYSLHTQ